MPEFKDMLITLRKRNGLTQGDLASMLGMSGSTISMYERGERAPSKEAMEAIADHFNVPLDYLLGRNVVVNKSPSFSDLIDLEEVLPPDEVRLVELYRRADEIDKQTIRNILSRYDEKRCTEQSSIG